MFGAHGKILRVDLSAAKISQEEFSESVLRKYLGGAGLATKYLWDEVKKGADPLGAENELIFMTGPLTGTVSPSTGRYSVVAKSPLTGIWGQSNSAGYWGVDFKKTGFDGIIFQGASAEPVYLMIDGEKAELRSAKHLWGKSVSETTRLIKAEAGERLNVASIGIAGENRVLYAAIINDLHRAAGRCGMGAVMGSKGLKAIAVSGKEEVKIADPVGFAKVSKKQYELLAQVLIRIAMETYGTNMAIDLVNVRGAFPTRNWQTGVFPNLDEISSVAMNEKVLVKRVGCFACPIKCGRQTEIRKGPYAGTKGEGPEYESVGALGGMCGIDDMEAITMAHYLCDDYGLDTISTGSTIGFAMECYEKGALSKSDTEGLELEFGNPEIMIALLHKIAKREGIGDLLAEGVKRASGKIGKGTERFAMHVKGLELPAYDSRALQLSGLAYASANRGGDHITAYIQGPTFLDYPFLIVDESRVKDPLVADPSEVFIVKDLEDALTVFDCVGACKFMGMGLATPEWIDLIRYGLGWMDFTVNEFRTTGERVYNFARSYSIREGLTQAGDTLPKRLLEDPLPEGPAKGKVNELAPLLDAYYELRGWDKSTGKPTQEKLKELGLDELIPEIWGY